MKAPFPKLRTVLAIPDALRRRSNFWAHSPLPPSIATTDEKQSDINHRFVRTILHLIPTLEGGGAERQLAMLAAEQARRGANVHVALRRMGLYGNVLRRNGVNIHEIGDFRGFSFRMLWSLHMLVRRTKPTVIQTWLPAMDILGGLTAAFHRVPWLISERSSAPDYKSGLANRVRTLLARLASGVVANSKGGLKYWREIAPRGLSYFLVPNAIAHAEIEEAPAQSLAATSSSYVLVVGRLIPRKGVHIVLEAALNISDPPPIRFVIVGDGPERGRIERKISEAGVTERVILLPYDQNWWGMLKCASALISMAQHEGCPNVVLEAMAAGCPLIVSDIAAHRELLDENTAILVPKDNSKQLADAIDDLLTAPQAARQRANLAKDSVRELTVGNAAEMYDAVYQAMEASRRNS